MLDMFTDNQLQQYNDIFGTYHKYNKFSWAVGVFSGNGANECIKYALDARLEVFFPHRLNKNGDFVPLWKNYLFIEYISPTTIAICRQSQKFYGFISFGDDIELVNRSAIDECLRLLQAGEYNYSFYDGRQYIRKGRAIKIASEDNFNGKLVRLLCDITPDMNDNKRVPVDFGNLRLMIEVGKLRL